MKFTWDPKKAASNVADHDGVTFDEAVTVFSDENYLPIFDNDNCDAERRHDAIGFSAQARLL